jgi:capsule polysaccharide export protein KpsE/RkpR
VKPLRSFAILFIVSVLGISVHLNIQDYRHKRGVFQKEQSPLVIHDTVIVAKDTLVKTVTVVDTVQLAKERARYQRLAVRYDSLRHDAIIARMQINQAKNYLKICQRNPSQKKFIVGWMRRAFDMR